MSGLSIRSMELNRRWGIAEIVQNSGWPKHHPQGLTYCTSMVGFELARHHVPAYNDQKLDYTPEPRVACAQLYYDPILLAKARSLPSVTIRHMTSLDSFSQDEDGVTATVTDRQTRQKRDDPRALSRRLRRRRRHGRDRARSRLRGTRPCRA